MTKLTAFCQIAALGINMRERGVYQKILSEFLKKIDESKISALQLTPEGWPIKCKITLTHECLKDEIVSRGLELFDKHIDFEDDNDLLIKIVVKDGHAEWDDDLFTANLCEYAKVVMTEKEWLHLNGRRTKISTGTRYVYATEILKHIPQKFQFTIDDRNYPVTIWCPSAVNKPATQEQAMAGNQIKCRHCGAGHKDEECAHKKKVCFICQKGDHNQRECPDNKGVRYDDKTLIFFNSKSPLSNWNTEYPFKVDQIEYLCVEQFLTVEKAYAFNNQDIARQAMNCTNPKEIRTLGENLRNFNVREWTNMYDDVMKKALYHKFSDPSARGAREHLLCTQKRTIGEASKHNYWGTGLSGSEVNALDPTHWTGANMLGIYLMSLRKNFQEDEAQAALETQRMVREASANTNEHVTSTPPNENTSFNENLVHVQGPTKYAIVFGDGNVPKDITDASELLPLKIVDMSKGEMKLTDVKDATEKCMVPKDDVEFTVLHLGSCHWHENEEVCEAEDVFVNVENAITQICDAFPKAEFVFSGVPLREPSLAGDSAEKCKLINTEIEKFNMKLQAFARSERTVTFCDNSSNIRTSEKLKSGEKILYENSNQLNEEGRCRLRDNIKKALEEAMKISFMAGQWQMVKPKSGASNQ